MPRETSNVPFYFWVSVSFSFECRSTKFLQAAPLISVSAAGEIELTFKLLHFGCLSWAFSFVGLIWWMDVVMATSRGVTTNCHWRGSQRERLSTGSSRSTSMSWKSFSVDQHWNKLRRGNSLPLLFKCFYPFLSGLLASIEVWNGGQTWTTRIIKREIPTSWSILFI